KASETILRNVRVLATDQSTEATKEKGKTVVRAFRTVTLEVTPRIAEKVAVAQTLGTLSLSLRSIADNQSELERAVASGDIKVPEGATKAEEDRILSAALNKPIEGSTSFVTGGDVSRFARRSMPVSDQAAARGAAMATGNASAPAVAAAPAVPRGPVVRVTRGKNTSEVEVGKK
ncbi:MAG: Flp pilus assembly protein CpaB, partial [Pseudomonadota bacterium]